MYFLFIKLELLIRLYFMNKFKNKILYLIQVLQFSINYLTNKNFSEKKLLGSIVGNEINVFDVGSNLGSYIKFVSNQNKNKILNFYSFEPNENIIADQKKIKLPTLHKLNINNVGVSNENTVKPFFKRKVSSQSSFLEVSQSKAFNNLDETLLVETVRIDDFCQENDIGYIDILKIDTEGLEHEVLTSALNMIKNKKIGIIKIEIFDKMNSIFNLLINNGYKLVGITNTTYIENKLFVFDAYFQLQ